MNANLKTRVINSAKGWSLLRNAITDLRRVARLLQQEFPAAPRGSPTGPYFWASHFPDRETAASMIQSGMSNWNEDWARELLSVSVVSGGPEVVLEFFINFDNVILSRETPSISDLRQGSRWLDRIVVSQDWQAAFERESLSQKKKQQRGIALSRSGLIDGDRQFRIPVKSS